MDADTRIGCGERFHAHEMSGRYEPINTAMFPPLVKGGQGRSAMDVLGGTFNVVLAITFAVGIVVGVCL
jgi:hypothetical protein